MPFPPGPNWTPPTVRFEYGIRLRRSGELHRTGLTRREAYEFLDPTEWPADANPAKVFELIRRPLGDWEVVNLDKEPS